MKQIKLHTGSVMDICDDEMNMKDFIHTKLNYQGGREEKDDPFFVCDLGNIVKKWRHFQKFLPMIKPFYDVKCNPDPEVIRLMVKLGTNFDCASKMEIQSLLDIGVSPEKIMFGNPCKQKSLIKYAASNNIKLMTFDNKMELHKIKKIFPDADLLLRICIDDSQSKSGIKFGADPSECLNLLQCAKQLQLNVIGVSFQMGNGCSDVSLLYDAVKLSRKVFDEGREIGYNFSMLDVGGGFPGDESAKITFEQAAEKLKESLENFFPPESNVTIIANPGRFLVASSFTNICNVTSVRKVEHNANKEDTYMYYLNDGVYGSFNCVMYDQQYPTPYALTNDGELFRSSVWGPTCDPLDCIGKSTFLPKINIGDWMYFPDMGAYTIRAGSKINGFKQPKVFYMCRRKYYETVSPGKNVEPRSPITADLKKVVFIHGNQTQQPLQC